LEQQVLEQVKQDQERKNMSRTKCLAASGNPAKKHWRWRALCQSCDAKCNAQYSNGGSTTVTLAIQLVSLHWNPLRLNSQTSPPCCSRNRLKRVQWSSSWDPGAEGCNYFI